MKILTVVGARPQFIKAAPVSKALHESGINEVLIHTGQHHDKQMSDVFFNELNIKEPDYNLGIAGGTHAQMTGRMLSAIEELLISETPSAVLVYGDTNSTLAAALAASKLHIKVIHIEAGLRSWNRRMPEEVNRVLTDNVSDLLLCPSHRAVLNLQREGIEDSVYEVGDVMADVCRFVMKNPPDISCLLSNLGIDSKEYCLATFHRAENTDSKEQLASILDALGELPVPVVFPIHPRTRDAIERYELMLPPNFILAKPLGYADMIGLLLNTRLLYTDSGGLQKEAYWTKTPCATLRNDTEWIETVDAGWNRLVGSNQKKILEAFEELPITEKYVSLYGDGDAANKCAELIYKHIS